MRAVVLVLLILAMGATLQAVEAGGGTASPAASTGQAAVMTDPSGDVQVYLDGEPVAPAQGERWALHDLLALNVTETPVALVFRLDMERLHRDTNVFFLDSVNARISFVRGDVDYVLEMRRNMGLGTDIEPGYYASLEKYSQEGFMVSNAPLDIEVDEQAATMKVAVPRNMLLDHAERLPLPGHALERMWVETSNFLTANDYAFLFVDALRKDLGVDAGPDSGLRVTDRMPDSGNVTYGIRTGFGDGQGASLSTQEPLRVSNGEATTLVYGLDLRHDAGDATAFRFTAQGPPSGWNVWFPVQDAEVDAGQLRTVPVAVRVPFAHSHGSIETVTVRAEALQDVSVWAESDVGIHYPEVPQPSGHHDTLHIHSAASPFFFSINGVPGDETDPVTGGYGWLNAVEEDEADEDVPVGSGPMGFGDRNAAGWRLPLVPALAMGLDVASASQGTAELRMRSERPMSGLLLAGEVVHVDGDGNGTPLMDLESQETLDVDAQESFIVTADIVPTNVSRVPYTPRAGLEVAFWFEIDGADAVLEVLRGDSFELLGGSLRLPLNEYHDAVDASFAADQAFRLVGDVQERIAAPGSIIVFDARVEQDTNRSGDYRLALDGRNVGWARLETPEGTRAEPGASLPLQVVVTVPPDAPGGDGMDILVEAVDSNDPVRRSLLRLVLRVDAGAETVDESDRIRMQAPAKESPAPWGWAGAAVGLALLRRIPSRRS